MPNINKETEARQPTKRRDFFKKYVRIGIGGGLEYLGASLFSKY